MNQNIRTGLIGLGRIGWNFHACEIDKHEYFDLISVSDLRNDFLEEGISKYHCKGYSNYQEMIDNDALDLVVIATPTILHYPMLISCLESGKNVICEKPLVLNYKEALHIKEISIKNNCILTTYQPRRLSGYFQNILSLIENDQIGDVFWVHFSDFRYSIRNDWQSLKKYGGGMLRNYGAHFIDQMLKIIGYDIKDISCLLVKNITLGDAEDLVKIICVTTNNVIGEITINQGSPINPYELIVWGKQGTITYHNDKIKLTEYDPNSIKIQKLDHNLFSENRKFPFHELDINTREIKVKQGDGINLYDDFARAFYKKEQPTVKIDETLEVVKFIDECFATTSNES